LRFNKRNCTEAKVERKSNVSLAFLHFLFHFPFFFHIFSAGQCFLFAFGRHSSCFPFFFWFTRDQKHRNKQREGQQQKWVTATTKRRRERDGWMGPERDGNGDGMHAGGGGGKGTAHRWLNGRLALKTCIFSTWGILPLMLQVSCRTVSLFFLGLLFWPANYKRFSGESLDTLASGPPLVDL